ncbi:MAG: hypothetical protein AB4368_30215 [Xenococcaceae cyanobacterium]
MKELIQLQQTLKRRIFIYSLVSHSHSYILPMVGAFMIGFFFDNDLLRLIGCGIFLYVLAFGVGLIVPNCDRRITDLMKKQLELEQQLKRLEAVNQSLDERRDMMLFDEDSQYWQILEDLAV